MKKIFLVVLLGLFSTTMFAQQENSGSLWSFTYDMAFSTGKTNDYIGKASFRGMMLDGRGFIDDNISLGGNVGWNVFYEKTDKATLHDENITLTGTQYKYINAFPMFFNAAYYFNEGSYIRPYVAANIGVIYDIQRTEMGLYAYDNDDWKFAFAPEAGVAIQTQGGVGFMINVRYNYGLKTKYIDPISYIGLNLGLLW